MQSEDLLTSQNSYPKAKKLQVKKGTYFYQFYGVENGNKGDE